MYTGSPMQTKQVSGNVGPVPGSVTRLERRYENKTRKDVTRILYVHHGKGMGGAPLSLLYLLRGLDRERFEATVLCLHESEASEKFRSEGVEVIVDEALHDFSHTNVLWYPWWQFPKTLLRIAQFAPTYFRARRFLRSRQFDIVHLNTSTLTAFGLAARHEGLRIVWHIREPLHPGYLGIRRGIIRRIIHRCADIIIPICHHDAEQLIPDPRIHVVYNFIDFTQFDACIDGGSVRRELGIPMHAPLVLMLGGVSKIKGTLTFIDAALRLLDSHPQSYFVVAGPIPDNSLRNRINTSRVYRDVVFGRIPEAKRRHVLFPGVRSDIPELLAASDILCVPSTVAHFARPAIEAAAMRVPVVASDLGGPRELLRDGETGYLVPSGDVAAMSEAMRRLLDDPPLRERMGLAGERMAKEKFDAKKNTAVVIQLYDGLMKKRAQD